MLLNINNGISLQYLNENNPKKTEKHLSRNIILDLKRKNLDNIIGILSNSTPKGLDFDRLLSLLDLETKSFSSLGEFRKNGIYILILNFIKMSSDRQKELFIFTLIENAEKYPIMVFGLLYDIHAFGIRGFSEINKIKELFRIIKDMRIQIS